MLSVQGKRELSGGGSTDLSKFTVLRIDKGLSLIYPALYVPSPITPKANHKDQLDPPALTSGQVQSLEYKSS